ncbi:DUF2461 family protein [Flindersiella endophytica]
MGIDLASWTEEAYDLLRRLGGDPSPAVLRVHREEHDQLVRRPMQALSDALGDVGGYGRAWLSAVSADPATWRRTVASVWVARRVRIDVVFGLDGLVVEGGWTGKSTDQLWRYRAAVDADHSGCRLAEIIADLDEVGFGLTKGQCLTKMPRGYPRDHPRVGLLLRRTVFVRRDLGTGTRPQTEGVVEQVREATGQVLPLASWFVAHVATSRAASY